MSGATYRLIRQPSSVHGGEEKEEKEERLISVNLPKYWTLLNYSVAIPPSL